MQARIIKAKSSHEFYTSEKCFISENLSLENLSIARAKVAPETTTKMHHLKGVDEVYLITEGNGMVSVGTLQPTEVTAGDTVYIPAGTPQRITNIGNKDLVFYCICTPKFDQNCYCEEEP